MKNFLKEKSQGNHDYLRASQLKGVNNRNLDNLKLQRDIAELEKCEKEDQIHCQILTNSSLPIKSRTKICFLPLLD